MLRLTSPVALGFLLLTGVPAAGQQACPIHPPANGAGLGEAVLIDFGPDSTITTVFVRVREDLLRPWVVDDFALDITITSVDGINHFHGTDVIPLSEGTSASQSGELVTLDIPWTEDDEPQVTNDLYSVCVQLVAGAPVAPGRCQDFGPFF